MPRKFQIAGAIIAALAVALGAFGAHGLKAILDPGRLDIYETGIRYMTVHALALMLCGWFATGRSDKYVFISGWAFTIGIAAFSGSLIVLALTGWRILGAVAPVGGLSFIVGWLSLAMFFARDTRSVSI